MNKEMLLDNIKQIHGLLKAIEANMPDNAELVIHLSSVYLSLGQFCLTLGKITGINIDVQTNK